MMRVEAARLAGAGLAGDEDVRHRRQVHHHGLAGDVAADGDLERVRRPAGLGAGEDVAEGDHLAHLVGHLDADGLLAGDRGEDADVGRRHRVGDVLVARRELLDLHARRQLELVAGDGRADDHARQAGLDLVLGEGRLEQVAAGLDGGPVDRAASSLRLSRPSAGSFHGEPGGARRRGRWRAARRRRRRRRRPRSLRPAAGAGAGALGRRRRRPGRRAAAGPEVDRRRRLGAGRRGDSSKRRPAEVARASRRAPAARRRRRRAPRCG